ncbi:MAG TPA: hypothetical protein VG897_13170 [Terriglobales bacterium]|nr:hypothetical protein [Terriglobales bacterium]
MWTFIRCPQLQDIHPARPPSDKGILHLFCKKQGPRLGVASAELDFARNSLPGLDFVWFQNCTEYPLTHGLALGFVQENHLMIGMASVK